MEPTVEKAPPDRFCPLPFTQLQLSSDSTFKPCCKFEGQFESEGIPLRHPTTTFIEAWTSTGAEQLRKSFLAGEKPASCRECWREEQAGLYSLRQIRIETTTQSQLDILKSEGTRLTPESLDLKLSNLCNLKCRICGAAASSSWEEEIRQKENPYLRIDHKNILSQENLETFKTWLPHLRRIEIFGGEPLMNPEFYKILDLCIDSGHSRDITIHCNSNGTVFSSKYVKKFDQFKEISIYFSIDDIDERFTYQRYPAPWPEVKENLRRFSEARNSHTHFGINCTVSLFNVYYLPEFIGWAESQSFQTGFNVLHMPQYFSIVNLPESAKASISERLSSARRQFPAHCASWEPIINLMRTESDPRLIRQALAEIKKIDGFRDQSFARVFPEMWELLKSYQ